MAYYQQDRLSLHSRHALSALLAQLLLANEELEPFREALARLPDFDSLALFRLLDQQQKGYFCEKDLHRFIGSKHRKLLTYAFSWVDQLKSGEVSRLEFAAFLLPRDDLVLREAVVQRLEVPQPYEPSSLLQQVSLFRELVLTVMRREMRLIELRRALLQTSDYSVQAVLLAIDDRRHGFVCGEDLLKFLQGEGVDAGLLQVHKLVEALSSGLDGKLSEEQLQWAAEGLEGTTRAYLERVKKANRKPCPRNPVHFEPEFQVHRQVHAPFYLEREQRAVKDCRATLGRVRLLQEMQEAMDEQLLSRQQASLQRVQQDYHHQQRIRRQRRQEQAIREEQLAQQTIARQMQRELETLISRTVHLEQDAQRLARLENRREVAQGLSNTRRKVGHQGPSPLNLNNNTWKQLFQEQPANSDRQLRAARELQQRIRRQREVERTIRGQFSADPLARYRSELPPPEQEQTALAAALERTPESSLFRGSVEPREQSSGLGKGDLSTAGKA